MKVFKQIIAALLFSASLCCVLAHAHWAAVLIPLIAAGILWGSTQNEYQLQIHMRCFTFSAEAERCLYEAKARLYMPYPAMIWRVTMPPGTTSWVDNGCTLYRLPAGCTLRYHPRHHPLHPGQLRHEPA